MAVFPQMYLKEYFKKEISQEVSNSQDYTKVLSIPNTAVEAKDQSVCISTSANQGLLTRPYHISLIII